MWYLVRLDFSLPTPCQSTSVYLSGFRHTCSRHDSGQLILAGVEINTGGEKRQHHLCAPLLFGTRKLISPSGTRKGGSFP